MSVEAQTRTNEAKIPVNKKTALKKVREKVVSLEAQTRTNEAKITVLL